jgi:two-component system LytT family sensor kinase
MIIVGIIIHVLLGFLSTAQEVNDNLVGIFISIFITIAVWEGSFQIDKYMNKKLPWEVSPARRVILQAFFSLVYSASTIYILLVFYNYVLCKVPESKSDAMVSASLIIGVLVTLVLVTVQVSVHFFNRLKISLVEIEMHKKESLQAQLENLRNQINPHFLFNNLSVLSSLVYKDQDKAVDFIDQLSKVYRYVLENKEKELVDLKSELKFIESYCFLLKIRFGENIKFNFKVSTTESELFIAPMALQLLIENAIKHNEISEEMPLEVKIYIDGKYLIISNRIQLRKGFVESSKTGLKNIIARYGYFTKQSVIISDNDGDFTVKIPLLETDFN